MGAHLLLPHELARRCDPSGLLQDDSAGGPAEASVGAPEIVGQERAREAVAFGLAVQQAGHHLFVTGPTGSGRRTLARQAIAARLVRDGVTRWDWVYVNHFDQPHRPLALRLPRGRAAPLRQHLRELCDDLRTTIPATFESEEHAAAVERLHTEFKERAEQAVLAVGAEAQRHGLVMVRTPVGLSFVPRKHNEQGEDEVLDPKEFEALPQAEREQLQQAMQAAQEQLVRALRSTVRLRKEHADRLRELTRSMMLVVVEHAVAEIQAHYRDLPEVLAWLDAVREDVTDKATRFHHAPTEDGSGTETTSIEIDLSPYEVNVLVDGDGDGAPVVELDHPTHPRLIGRIDHLARMGTLLTDYRLIKPGALHRANGGYLLIDAEKLLVQPFAWDALKRALLNGEVRIESIAEHLSLVSTVQLEPMPVPLAVKVVLFGHRRIAELLQTWDVDFPRLFRVIADVDDDLPRTPATQQALARSLLSKARAQALLEPSAAALGRLIDHGAREAGDATRIGARVQRLVDVLTEADHLARAAQHTGIEAGDIAAALAARRRRASRIDERLRGELARGTLMIDTHGERVGQVNGLMVYESAGETFGEPVRITATTRLGSGEVIDIQRETRLGGPIHAKGVLILSAFLAARYARLHPLALHASLVFEQTYGFVEGDSASLAELLALLSSIAEVPIRQGLAVTGSVNQFGDVQAIGGVNEKIEGFFDLCAARGLDGSHGVVIPQSNVAHLMLREDVAEAVAAGRFSVHAVGHVDDAIEVLTGLAAGAALAPQPDSINGRIGTRLRRIAQLQSGEPRWTRRQGGAASMRTSSPRRQRP
ncbi:ATP-dependent protease [Sphaerotilus microaerophilus]|uniref:endopeptidase La n=1 Tax=Sphaerotilus microaerophilus TaxID=2914710 RepID=A0ABN6PMC6_9BURK|nr:ATP-dependent protease [Sphaerotilus sp. FB-5]